MFTGIVESSSVIKKIERQKGGVRISVQTPKGWRVPLGSSVALDGICLTSVGASTKNLEFDLMEETLSKTTAKNFKVGSIVNLERPLKANGELGGHFVQGHVDTYAPVRSVRTRGFSHDLTIEISPSLRFLVAEVGSIAINGVSLTVSKKRGRLVTVSLIPHTIKFTNLGLLKRGDRVNVEVDVLARYLAALWEK